MDVLLSIVKGKGVSNEYTPPSKLATFTENSDAKRTMCAEVAELADAQDLGSCGRKAVGVQLPPSAPDGQVFVSSRVGQ
jgi:hypothetical protein